MNCFCKRFGSSTIASALRGHGLLSELIDEMFLQTLWQFGDCLGFTRLMDSALYEADVKELLTLVESMDFLNSSNNSSKLH
jgi:hypothetical protein